VGSINKGSDTEYYCVICNVQRKAIKRGLILNITVFLVRVWGGQYREELILSVTFLL